MRKGLSATVSHTTEHRMSPSLAVQAQKDDSGLGAVIKSLPSSGSLGW